MPLPKVVTPGLRILLHQLTFRQESGFARPLEKVIENPEGSPLRIGGVSIDYAAEEVRVDFAWTRECGAPDRGWMRKTLVLAVSEWGQIVYNGRFAGEYGWWYEKNRG